MNRLDRAHVSERPNTSWMERAEQEAATRIFNCYLLETGSAKATIDRRARQLRLVLANSGVCLSGELEHVSEMGHHAYRFPLYEEHSGSDSLRPLSCKEVVTLILQELCAMHPAADVAVRCARLREQVDNSTAHIAAYLAHAAQPPRQHDLALVVAEQSLRCGHPLHPTPKSAQGFDDQALHTYAPELGASFRLHYWAVHRDELAEEWLMLGEQDAQLLPDEARVTASLLLGDAADDYALLPVHPWQSQYLQRENTEVRRMIGEQRFIPLGETGPLVYPTSSVRTVWSPEQGCFVKLPLHVRITNYIRVNTREQMARTMDAARICAAYRDELETGPLRLLMEVGYRSVNRDSLFAELAVVYRESPSALIEQGDSWFPVASLLEFDPCSREPLLSRCMSSSVRNRPLDWITRYAQVFLIPVLDVFARLGISLEAHVQNSLIRLDEEGLPVRCLIRDLEGISIDRRLAAEQGWIGNLLSADSPVLYGREAAFERLLYYGVTNHMGHVIATVARQSHVAERTLWQQVRHVLAAEAAQHAPFHAVVSALLEREALPAKANLTSQLLERGETPVYIAVPNLLCEREHV